MKKTVPLNDKWLFMPEFSQEVLKEGFNITDAFIAPVPHSAVSVPPGIFDEKLSSGTYCYMRYLNIPEKYNGSKIVLKFSGILCYAEVYVNGTFITSKKGDTAFEADITAPVKYGYENIVIIKADSSLRGDVPCSMPYQFGGLFRDVFLEIKSGEYIKDIFINATDVLSEEKQVEIFVELDDYYPDTTLRCSIRDGVGNTVDTLPERAVLRRDTLIKGVIKGADLWDTENPVIYTAQIELLKDGKTVDERSQKFGFRKAEFKSGGFYLNGKNLKLKGLVRYDDFAYIGRAATDSLQEEDARILKQELGVNTVRCMGSPSHAFIDECDTLGLLVILDTHQEEYLGKTQWKETFISNLEDTVKTFRNHPSVIAYGTRVNNSRDYDELYFKTAKVVKDLDPTRQSLGARNFMSSRMYEDIFAFNDYPYKGIFITRKLSRIKSTAKLFVPYLVTEHTGKKFPNSFKSSEDDKLNAAINHLKVLDKMYKSKKIAGAIGMSFADFKAPTHRGSGDGLCNYGVTDIYRNMKLSGYAYKSQTDAQPIIEFSSNLAPDEFSGKLYVFTNCDYIKLYKDSDELGTFYPAKKQFKNIPHPPVIIDELSGGLLSSEGMRPFEIKLFKHLLKRAERRSLLNLGFIDKLLLKLFRLTLRLSIKDTVKLFRKYARDSFENYKIRAEGYIGGECVIEKVTGSHKKRFIKISQDKLTINISKSYEIAKIDITAVDERGAVIKSDFSPIEVLRDGAVDIIGPSRFSLSGGHGTVYVKSIIEGSGKVTIIHPDGESVISAEVIYDGVEGI